MGKSKRKGKKKRVIPGDHSDPFGMAALAEKHCEWLAVRNYSKTTIHGRRVYLSFFLNWAYDRGLYRPGEITKPILERYQRWLYRYRKEDGSPLSFRSQHTYLVSVRAYFKWLTRENHILYNPASELELPKLDRRLPKHVLTVSEVEQIINSADITTALGLRDRAILETFYSTGMRRMELINLKLYDIDADRGTVIIRQGKGKKDRMIPIGQRALLWIDKYMNEARPKLVFEPDRGVLFLTKDGDIFIDTRLTHMVSDYVKNSGINKSGSCHLFRHTMATLMLEGGADIRFIQEMLGHASIATTQIYTQVSIRKLKAIHDATHPARLERTRSFEDLGLDMQEELEEAVLDELGEELIEEED